jgi:hypothetical protein
MGLINYIDIDWPDLFKPILTSETNFFNRIRVNREVIPIIFVPGIMGSRLEVDTDSKIKTKANVSNDKKKKKISKLVWDPDDKGFMVKHYGRIDRSAAYRKSKLIGPQFESTYLKVSEEDTEHNQKFFSMTDPWRDRRGWGGIFWSSYGGFLQELEYQKWDKPLISDNEKEDEKVKRRKELVGKCFEFPVHAFGYNWTDTNYNAGKKLAAKITEIIAGYQSKGRMCKYVILVSHSMGGLVCRSACCDKIGNAESNVLGVIHGVQPATGSAAAYWRMKAGFERPHGGPSDNAWDWLRNPKKMTQNRVEGRVGSWVLGTDGEEVTSILGNAPGGLELLPNKHYTNNANKPHWLHVPNRKGVMNSLPRNGDPYEEIYKIKDDVFWRMVNPEWLAPEGGRDSSNEHAEIDDPWGSYSDNLNKAKKFHNTLRMRPHPETYQFYSSGFETVDEIRFKRKKHTMYPYVDPETGIEFNSNVYHTTRGKYVHYLNSNDGTAENVKDVVFKVSMAMPGEYKAGGDSTVPDSSGKALKVKKTTRIGIASRSDWFEQDHQNIYKSKKAKELVYKAVRNLALKRIEDVVGPVGKK